MFVAVVVAVVLAQLALAEMPQLLLADLEPQKMVVTAVTEELFPAVQVTLETTMAVVVAVAQEQTPVVLALPVSYA